MGCDTQKPYNNTAGKFQSTHPCGVRRLSDCGYRPKTGFNPRTRVGCDLTWLDNYLKMRSFNPRTRVGCDCLRAVIPKQHRGFNPRTRVGCDVTRHSRYHYEMFQSTHPCGVRLKITTDKHRQKVSIHAPVWGATCYFSYWRYPNRFQSTHPCGVRRFFVSWFCWFFLFQSTHPCGVRRSDNHALRWIVGFNPRTRVGCDQPLENLSIYYQVSIHAPVWGATVLASRIF